MEIISYVVGTITGMIVSICFYEYQRWRERSEDKKQKIGKLKLEINHFIDEWENFKKTDDLHVNPYLNMWQKNWLPTMADSFRNHALELEGIVTKDILENILEISNKIRSLSVKEFYIDGGKSWEEFINMGDQISKECSEIKEKLGKC